MKEGVGSEGFKLEHYLGESAVLAGPGGGGRTRRLLEVVNVIKFSLYIHYL